MVEYKHSDLTQQIIGCAMKVHRTIGVGFPEIIYQRSLIIEFKNVGLRCETEVEKEIFYEGNFVGSRRLDLLINDLVIVEIKAIHQIDQACVSQLLNYLRVFKVEVGLLLNFGEKSLKFHRYAL